MRIAIRADAAQAMGIGHVKRCVSLAQALRSAGAEVFFFWQKIDVDCTQFLGADGFEGTCIEIGPIVDEGGDALNFLRAAEAYSPDAVIVDHYRLSAVWQRQVRERTGARMIAIDDIADRDHDVDILVDHNCSDDHAAKYSGVLLNSHAIILGGPSYAILAPRFVSKKPARIKPIVESIGVFMGGTDEFNLSELAVDACRVDLGFSGRIEIATTRNNPHLARLQHCVNADPQLALLTDQPDLAEFFGRHDLHLGAGGGATWERCCMGAPTVAIIAADNQRHVIIPIERLGVLRMLHEVPPSRAGIASIVDAVIRDEPLRAAMAAAGQTLVDGRGAIRIAEHILSL